MSKTKDMDAAREIFRSGDYVVFPLENVVLEWASHLATPDTKFDTVGKYKVNAIIDSETAEKMEEIGFNVRKDKEGRSYVVPTRKPELGAPLVVNTAGDPVDPMDIGNGSIATIEAKTKFMVIAGKEFQPVYIEKIVVSDIVEYSGKTTSIGPL